MKQYLSYLLIAVSILNRLYGSENYYADTDDEEVSSVSFSSSSGYVTEDDMSPSEIVSINYDGMKEEIIPINDILCNYSKKVAAKVVRSASPSKTNIIDDLLELAYALPEYRHAVRKIVTKKLKAGCKDPVVLMIGQDIPQLRYRFVNPIIVELLNKPCDDLKILMLALNIPAVRSQDIERKFINSVGCALMDVFEINKYDPAILQLAFDIPDYRDAVEAFVEERFKSNPNPEPAILQIALCMPQLRKKALYKARALLLTYHKTQRF